MLATATAPTSHPHTAHLTMGSSSASQPDTQPPPDEKEKEAAPLPDAYKSFLNSISRKITRYLDEDDSNNNNNNTNDTPPPKDAPQRDCPACGRPRDTNGRHDPSPDHLRKRCTCH